jgi:hypothetical protein
MPLRFEVAGPDTSVLRRESFSHNEYALIRAGIKSIDSAAGHLDLIGDRGLVEDGLRPVRILTYAFSRRYH